MLSIYEKEEKLKQGGKMIHDLLQPSDPHAICEAHHHVFQGTSSSGWRAVLCTAHVGACAAPCQLRLALCRPLLHVLQL